MSHPFCMRESWNASLWAPLILKPIKKGMQLSPTSRAAPATIWEWVPWAEKAWQPLKTCVSHGGLQCCIAKGSPVAVPTVLPAKLTSSSLEFGRGTLKGDLIFILYRAYLKKISHSSQQTYSDSLHLFNWHNTTRAYKRGLVAIPAPSLRRCPSRTANDPSQIAPAIYCDPPTMSHRIRDEGHMVGLHPSCPSHGPRTPSSPEWLTDPSPCTWAHAPLCWPQPDGQLNWAKSQLWGTTVHVSELLCQDLYHCTLFLGYGFPSNAETCFIVWTSAPNYKTQNGRFSAF